MAVGSSNSIRTPATALLVGLVLAVLPGCGLLLDPYASEDGGLTDVSTLDASRMDSGRADAGRADGSAPDAEPPVVDAEVMDAEVDAEVMDAEVMDAEPPVPDAEPVDAEPADGGAPVLDAGEPDGDVCLVTVEICDNADNDCDGHTDEGFDLNSDSDHCGACNRACGVDSPACVGGSCTLCPLGFSDCDSGGVCFDLTQPDHCGACGNECLPSEFCTFSPGAGGGCTSCPSGEVFCGLSCISVESDPLHCGGCAPCPALQPHCAGGTCSACPDNFADCNRDLADGCEVNLQTSNDHCNGCDTSCGTMQVCASGLCTAL